MISSLNAIQTVLNPNKSKWEVVLTTGKTITEDQLVLDIRRGGYRQIDWALDLNTTGDLLKIKELWLITPGGHRTVHRGASEIPIVLQITEPGTAFQFKHTNHDFLGGSGRIIEAQCIGKITDKDTGDCQCWIWDRVLGLIEYKSNVNNFGMWRKNSGLMPLTKLSHDVTGLRLG